MEEASEAPSLSSDSEPDIAIRWRRGFGVGSWSLLDGAGDGKEYLENREGRLIEAKGDSTLHNLKVPL